MESAGKWSRRRFLAAAGSGVMAGALPAWAASEVDPRVAAIVAASMGIDSHNHVDVPLTAADVAGPELELAGELKRSGLAAISMTFAVDYQKLRNPGEAFERFQHGLTAMDRQLARNGMRRALNLADLRAAHARGQPTVIQSVEGGHFLEGRVERLADAHQRGLRHLTLLHDNDATPPLGDVYTNPPRWGGLTALGADVIRECERLGVLVDLAHADIATANAALKVATRPVLISHTGLDTRLGDNPRMAQMMRPRLISKEQAKVVADAGGVIGVWTHLADTPLAYAENIKAMADVVGIEHVCIGTDTKLTRASRPGEGSNQAWRDQSAGFYYAVVEAMLNSGFAAADIAKVGGANFCRIFDLATAQR